jgi:hypothetical protein
MIPGSDPPIALAVIDTMKVKCRASDGIAVWHEKTKEAFDGRCCDNPLREGEHTRAKSRRNAITLPLFPLIYHDVSLPNASSTSFNRNLDNAGRSVEDITISIVPQLSMKGDDIVD